MEPDSKYWRVYKKPVKIAFYIVSIVGFVIFSFSSSSRYADYTKRAKMSEVVGLGYSVTHQVTEMFIERQIDRIASDYFKDRWPTEASEFLTYSHVTENGKIFMFSRKFGALIVLTPEITRNGNGKIVDVKWECLGQANQINIIPSKCNKM